MSRQSENSSSLLQLFYGDNYAKILGIDCICFDYEKNRTPIMIALKVFAFMLPVINIALQLWLYDFSTLFVFFTLWAVELSLALSGLVLWCSLDPDINEKKGRLALMHILSEVSTAFNIVALVTYWPFIHKYALELCEGYE